MDHEISISNPIELLIQWEFPETTQTVFLNAGIELEEFLNMGLNRLREFIPNDAERLQLIKCIMKYKMATSVSRQMLSNNVKCTDKPASTIPVNKEGSTVSSNSDDPDFDPDELLNKSLSSSSDSEDTPLAQLKRKRSDKECPSDYYDSVRAPSPDTPLAQLKRKRSDKETPSDYCNSVRAPSPGSDKVDDPNSESDHNGSKSVQCQVKEKNENSGKQVEATAHSPSTNRLHHILSKSKLLDLNLEELLKSSTTSAAVLVGNKHGILTSQNRTTLCDKLAEYMLNLSRSPTREEFILVRDKIYNLFPNEPAGLYYVAPKETGPHQRFARGKLYNAVRNKISLLIKRDVFVPLRKKTSSPLTEQNVEEPELSTDEQAAILSLKRAREINSVVRGHWRTTADVRLKQLYRQAGKTQPRTSAEACDENTENARYLDEYKVLKEPKGYTLLLIDFKHLYDAQSQNLYKLWPEIQKKLEYLALSRKIEDPVGAELQKELKRDTVSLDENNKDAVLLQLLASLCPPTARVTVGTKTFKPTVTEARDAFILYTPVGAELDPLIRKRRQRMSELKAPQQPYMIFQGPSRANIVATYIVFDLVKYKVDSVLECLDSCFKIFHSLCVCYPSEANHLWHFVHLYIYGVKHDPSLDGNVPLSTTEFIALVKSV